MDTRLDFSTVIQEKGHTDSLEVIYVLCCFPYLLAHRTGKLIFTESRVLG